MKPLNIFKPESYVEFPLNMTNQRPLITPDEAAKISTDILTKYLETQPVVYGPSKNYGANTWWEIEHQELSPKTHRARLIAIEEIEKKECVHEPHTIERTGLRVDFNNKTTAFSFDTYHCKHCGVELVAEWRVK